MASKKTMSRVTVSVKKAPRAARSDGISREPSLGVKLKAKAHLAGAKAGHRANASAASPKRSGRVLIGVTPDGVKVWDVQGKGLRVSDSELRAAVRALRQG